MTSHRGRHASTAGTSTVQIECPSCRTARDVSSKTARDIEAGRATGSCARCATEGRDQRQFRWRDPFPLGRDIPGMNGPWRETAACRGMDTELFYPLRESGRPEKGGAPDSAAVQAARAVCHDCPVRLDCLEAGIGEQHGIWGGKTPAERRALRKQRETAYDQRKREAINA